MCSTLERGIKGGKWFSLIESFLKIEIDDAGTRLKPTKGTPQGTVISPLLANLYLNELDWQMLEKGYTMIRYADDFVVLCDKAEDTEHALDFIGKWCETHKLKLHPNKTTRKEISTKEGMDFLGYYFISNGRCWISKKSLKKFRDNLRPHLKRCNRHGMKGIIAEINPKLKGYYNYFKQAGDNSHNAIDGWVRMRLRSILKRHEKKRGIGRGTYQRRYPNAYLAELGLFSLGESKETELSIWKQKS